MYKGGERTIAAGEVAEDDEEEELGTSRLGAENSSSAVPPVEARWTEENGGVFPRRG